MVSKQFALISCICSFLFFGKGYADEALLLEESLADDELVALGETLSRADAIPEESVQDATDHFLEGYIQALIDMNFYEFCVRVKVDGCTVYLSNLPKNDLIRNSIIAFVEDLPGVERVCVVDSLSDEEIQKEESYMVKPRVGGTWFPQTTVLFQPLIADPRQPQYYAEYRMGDDIMGDNTIAVALGDEFPIFRWRDVWPAHGDLQIGILSGIWSVFNMQNPHEDEFAELVNTDYLLGFPLSYAFDAWSMRLMLYHISSHLGDEFLVNNPGFIPQRVNPSFEAFEWITSYQLTSGFRFYGGPGFVLHSDSTFSLKTFYLKYGTEMRLLGKKHHYHRLYGTPFLAVNAQNWQVNHWQFDFTGMLGYEWSKLQGIGRKLRIYGKYLNGYGEGQFFKERTSFFAVGFSWGF